MGVFHRAAPAFAIVCGVLLLGAAACGDDEPRELAVLTHDSFDMEEELLARFEEEHGVTVTLIEGGDANEDVSERVSGIFGLHAEILAASVS